MDQHEKGLKEKGISCILLDGRRGSKKVLLEIEGMNKKFPGLMKEHYTVCSEPGGCYLFHFLPEPEGKKPAGAIADQIMCLLQERRLNQSLQTIGGDLLQ